MVVLRYLIRLAGWQGGWLFSVTLSVFRLGSSSPSSTEGVLGRDIWNVPVVPDHIRPITDEIETQCIFCTNAAEKGVDLTGLRFLWLVRSRVSS
jgi:hypothetical protein